MDRISFLSVPTAVSVKYRLLDVWPFYPADFRVISAALLYGVDRFEPWDDLLTALRRTILVAFPASFAATVVDNLGSAIDSGRG